ncbi:hypothetical protein A7982_12181 [Minicystis rosea]|nr:hypothetical protein A7982_12181 [Minicystis rosea]
MKGPGTIEAEILPINVPPRAGAGPGLRAGRRRGPKAHLVARSSVRGARRGTIVVMESA